MKKLLFILAFISLSALAGDLMNPRSLYNKLDKNFPGSTESHGSMTIIELKNLSCASYHADGPMVYECSGISLKGPVSSSGSEAKELFESMQNAGATLDGNSEPGTVYTVFKSVQCSKLECKPSKPSDCKKALTEFSCTGF